MNQQPEKLFRERLENYHRPVSAEAWSRIEARLDKKNDKAFILKIAAAIIFLLVSGGVVWQWNNNRVDTQLLSEKTKPESKTESPEKKKTTPPSNVVVPKKEVKEEKKVIEKKKVEPKKPVKEEFQAPLVGIDRSFAKVEEQAPEKQEIQESEVIVETITTEEQPIVVAENTITPQPEETKVKLVYSVAEVDEKYLDKKALADATSDEKKPSTLRKLWDKASDLKNNQEAFGDLRQKKNEILALNFKSEKRSQNK